MIWVLFLLLGLAAIYVVITLGLTIGLGRDANGEASGTPATVTVLICAHNEAQRIASCLRALSDQTYPRTMTQIIVVDDRSTDETFEIATSWKNRVPGLEVVRVDAQDLDCPKKNALQTGMAGATGEIVLTTDADCTPAPHWIASTVSRFGEQTGMVVGPAPLTNPGGRFAPLLVFQSLLVNALAAGSAGIGFPLTCSGRNLAFRREAFDTSGGYKPIGHIVGGDDVLLMRRIASTGWRVVYNHDPSAAVHSPAHLDRQWSRQIRYQSKARHYGVPILSLAILIYILHVLLLASPLFAWLAPDTIPILWSVLVVKAVADGVFLWRAARRLGYRRIFRWFPVVEILTVPYIAVFCALGTLRPPSWT